MALKIKTITIRTIDNEDFKQQILHLGKNQRQIANELGISESMLSRWMNGKTIIPEDKIDLLSEYIDKNSKEMYEFWKEKMEGKNGMIKLENVVLASPEKMEGL